MTRALIIHSAGPAVTVQDMGRAGYMAFGLSRGGAADRTAMFEGAALLGQDPGVAALEMGNLGGEFEPTQDMRIALTGAPMQASVDGTPLRWNASHLLACGARLVIGAAKSGSYGYLHLGGGIATPPLLGARCTHLAAGIGATLQPGTHLPIGPDAGQGKTGMHLPVEPRFDGGTLRIVPSLQTSFFNADQIAQFQSTEFKRDTRGNRMGVRLLTGGAGFQSTAGLSVLSEVIVPGDVQITGDGTPFVLLAECQTTGGYPRIGTVLPSDLPRIAQAHAGAIIKFQFVTVEQAVEIERRESIRRKNLRATLTPIVRNPHDITDLLSYQLISGVTAGDDAERDDT